MYRFVLVLLFLAVCLVRISCSPLSRPHINDNDIEHMIPDYFDTKISKKYFHRNASDMNHAKHQVRHIRYSNDDSCNVEFNLRWSTNVGSSVYSTPLIYPSGPEGMKQIFMSTYYQYIEILGYDGHKPLGWPLSFEGSSFRSSPMLYDVDNDGSMDIGIVDKSANLYWIRMGTFGQYLEDYHIQIPKLKVLKEWYKNLDPDYADNVARLSMFDRHGSLSEADLIEQESQVRRKHGREDILQPLRQDSYPEAGNGGSRKILEISAESDPESNAESEPESNADLEAEDEHHKKYYRVFDDDMIVEHSVPPGVDDYMAYAERRAGRNTGDGGFGDGGFNEGDIDDTVHDGRGEFQYGIPDRFGEGVTNGYLQDFYESGGFEVDSSKYVFVDPHVLSTPTLADVNNDGHMEIVMAVSYYFDAAESHSHAPDINIRKYVAGAIVCWDIEEQKWNWNVHLDLTTEDTKFKAYIHGSPTVADLDGDGRSEVIIGTSMGLLYVLDGETGFVRRHFPMQFGVIESQIAVADITGDGLLEILVTDMDGNVVVVTAQGDVLWDIRISGFDAEHDETKYRSSIPYTPTLGDVDADGQLDIVIVVESVLIDPEAERESDHGRGGKHDKRGRNSTKTNIKGHSRGVIWALNGRTGAVLEGYPITLPKGAMLSTAALLVDLHDYSDRTLSSTLLKSDPTLPPWMLMAHSNYSSKYADVIELDADRDGDGRIDASWDAGSITGAGKGNSLLRGFDAHIQGGHGNGRGLGLHIIVPSYDGHIYIIDGMKGCAERIDVGEHVFSMPVIDDLTGDGYLDMLVGTMNGEVLLFETSIPYHPLNAWASYPKYRSNGFTHGVVGISVPAAEKLILAKADIHGDRASIRNLEITFDIWDKRFESNVNGATSKDESGVVDDASELKTGRHSYEVVVTRGTNRMYPIAKRTFTKPGRYTMSIPVSPPEVSTYVIGMTTEHGIYYEDVITVAINTRFYIWFKYLILIPVLLLCLPLILLKKQKND